MSATIANAIRRLRRAANMRALYPSGHPIHAAALEHGREALADLLAGEATVELRVSGSGFSVGSGPIADDDGSLQPLASLWWDEGICTVSVSRGMTDAELDLLLEMSFPKPAEERGEPFVQRVTRLGAEHLAVAEIDYGRFQAASEAAISGDAGADLITRLIETASADAPELAAEEQDTLLSLLAHPEALALALQVGGTDAAAPDGVPEDESSLGMMAVREGGPADPQMEAAARLAVTIQRLADLARVKQPETLDQVHRQLAEALRRLDPDMVALAYRVGLAHAAQDADALADVARHFTVAELVGLVTAQPGAVAAEDSETYRKLLARLAPTPERVAELGPALREALLQNGMSEDVYANTVGSTLAQLATARASDAQAQALSAAIRTAPAEQRAARRAGVEEALQGCFGADAWVDRGRVGVELLWLADKPEDRQKAAADVRAAVKRAVPGRRRPFAHEIIGALVAEPPPPELEDTVAALVAGISDEPVVAGLANQLHSPLAEERQAGLRALSLSGAAGRRALIDRLIDPQSGLADEEVASATSLLLSARGSVEAVTTELAAALIGRQGAVSGALLAAVAARAGDGARSLLMPVLREANLSVRSALLQELAREPGRSIDLLALALRDPEPSVATAAADALGASRSPRAGPALVPHLRQFRARDPRLAVGAAVIKALGHLQYMGAVTPLSRVLGARTFLAREANDEYRAAAAEALLRIGTREALRVVSSHARGERCPRIRALALEAATRAAQTLSERGNADAA